MMTMLSKAALRNPAILFVGGSALLALADGVVAGGVADGDGKNTGDHSTRRRVDDREGGSAPRVTDADGGAWGSDHGTGQIGDDCYRHDFCASGVCSSWLFIGGTCVECNSDDDCEGHGQSLPGTLPKAFCHEGACSRWKRGHPLDERGYPVWLAHEDVPPIWVRRRVHEGGPPTKLVWRFDIHDQVGGSDTADAFEANATHIRIPTNVQLLAGYSLSNPMVREHETGIVTLAFAKNSGSTVTPYAKLGAGEKYHTLTYDGPMDEAHRERVSRELEARDAATTERAKNQQRTRTRLQAAAISRTDLFGMIFEAYQEEVQINQLRAYVQQVLNGDFPAKEIANAEMSDEATAAFELAKTLPSLKSMNQCTHFEERDGLGTTDTHLEFPLDSPVVFLKGISEFIPAHYFGLNAGHAIASYDADANVLEFQFEMIQSGRLYPYEPTYAKNGLWLSPIDDANPVDPLDGRSDVYYEEEIDYSFLKNEAFRQYLAMPIDYSIFDRSSTGTCDRETADDLSDLWLNIGKDENTDWLNDIANQLGLFRLSTEGATCGSAWLKGDGYEGMVGMDFLTLSVWSHTLGEQDDLHREATSTATHWDDWDGYYKEKSEAPKTKASKTKGSKGKTSKTRISEEIEANPFS